MLCVTYLVVLLISLFISAFVNDENIGSWVQFILIDPIETHPDYITPLGYVMLITGCICLVMLISSLIIVFLIPSPHTVRESISKLASSAIGGKKN
ncbi:MAG: hypothetical protein L3I91_01715 [Mycoplasma sp.]